MLRRLRSAIYGAPDLAAAKTFYAGLLGKPPYFDEPFYVGFELDGFELGLDPDAPAVTSANAYWRVDAIAEVIERAVALGGRAEGEPRDVGGGLTMATIIDPNGNHVGLIAEASK